MKEVNPFISNSCMAVKLDMIKAYDKVEWDFLEGMMKIMGVPAYWSSSIMKCVSFQVLLNGIPS